MGSSNGKGVQMDAKQFEYMDRKMDEFFRQSEAERRSKMSAEDLAKYIKMGEDDKKDNK